MDGISAKKPFVVISSKLTDFFAKMPGLLEQLSSERSASVHKKETY